MASYMASMVRVRKSFGGWFDIISKIRPGLLMASKWDCKRFYLIRKESLADKHSWSVIEKNADQNINPSYPFKVVFVEGFHERTGQDAAFRPLTRGEDSRQAKTSAPFSAGAGLDVTRLNLMKACMRL